jgi:hypothetical protein
MADSWKGCGNSAVQQELGLLNKLMTKLTVVHVHEPMGPTVNFAGLQALSNVAASLTRPTTTDSDSSPHQANARSPQQATYPALYSPRSSTNAPPPVVDYGHLHSVDVQGQFKVIQNRLSIMCRISGQISPFKSVAKG